LQAENQFAIEKIFARTTVWLDKQPDDGVSLNRYIGRLTRLLCDWMQGACEGSFADYEALIYLYQRVARYYGEQYTPANTSGLSDPYWRLFTVRQRFEVIDNTELIKQLYVATENRPDWHIITGMVSNVNTPPELLAELFFTYVNFDLSWEKLYSDYGHGTNAEQIAFFIVNNIAANQSCPGEVLSLLSQSPYVAIRFDVASNINTPPEILRSLSTDLFFSYEHLGQDEIDLPVVMWAVAGNTSTPEDVSQNLANLDLDQLRATILKVDGSFGSPYSLDGINGEHIERKVSVRARRTLDRVHGFV